MGIIIVRVVTGRILAKWVSIVMESQLPQLFV